MQDHIHIFSQKYESCEWGDNKNNKYKGSSGGGSSITFNQKYINFLRNFIDQNNIKKVVDLGCGDWQSSYLIYKNKDIQYYGYDAYEKIIINNQENYPNYIFRHIDILNQIDLIEDNCDLFILKDVIQHWTCNEINFFMDKLLKTKKFKYILINNSCAQKYDNQDEPYRSRPLSIKYQPLKKYNFKFLFNYNDKEVSLLTI